MINRGGFKIFGAEVETVLSGPPGVLEWPSRSRAWRRVHAFVVPRKNVALTVKEVRELWAERLSDYKVPEMVVMAGEPLPRNANGKIQKTALREHLVDRQ